MRQVVPSTPRGYLPWMAESQMGHPAEPPDRPQSRIHETLDAVDMNPLGHLVFELGTHGRRQDQLEHLFERKGQMRKGVVWLIVVSVVLVCICTAFAVAVATAVMTRAHARVDLSSQVHIELKAPAGSLVACKDGAFQVLQEVAGPPAATMANRHVLPTLDTALNSRGVLCHLRRTPGEPGAFELAFFQLDKHTFVFTHKVPLKFTSPDCPLLAHSDEVVCVVAGDTCALASFVLDSPVTYKSLNNRTGHPIRRLVVNEKRLACLSDFAQFEYDFDRPGFTSSSLGLWVVCASPSHFVTQDPTPGKFHLNLNLSSPGLTTQASSIVQEFEADSDSIFFVDHSQVVFVRGGRLLRFGLAQGETDLGLPLTVSRVWGCGKFVLVETRLDGFWVLRVDMRAQEVMRFEPSVFHGLDIQGISSIQGGLFAVRTKEGTMLLGSFPRFPLEGADVVGVAGDHKNGRSVVTRRGRLKVGKKQDLWQPSSVVLHDALSDSLLSAKDVGDPHTRSILAFTDLTQTVLVRP